MCTYIHTCVHQQTIHFVNTTNRFVYEPFYRDFGPLNLSQLYRYCHYMHEKLKSKPGMRICHWSPNDGSHAANSVRLYRVYMSLSYLHRSLLHYIGLFHRKTLFVRLYRVYMCLFHICIGLFCIYIGLFHRKTLSVRLYRVCICLFHICIGLFYIYIGLFHIYIGLFHILIGLFHIYIGLFNYLQLVSG